MEKEVVRAFKGIRINNEVEALEAVNAITEVLPKIGRVLSGSMMSINSRDNKIAQLERKLANVGQFVPSVTVDEVEAVVEEEATVEAKKVDRIAQMKEAKKKKSVQSKIDPKTEMTI